MKREQQTFEPGTPKTDGKYSIIIDNKGPYFVYGNPPIQQEIIETNDEGEAWTYRTGRSYKSDSEPLALCRCGHSKTKPYCDGTHTDILWDSQLTADHRPLLEDAEKYEGPDLELHDNPAYCVHARFCMAKGTVWRLIRQSDEPEKHRLTVRETFLCPSGRLKLLQKNDHRFLEPELPPAIGIIEDPQKECSGPLWIKGGIPIEDSECNPYEVRNRVTLCRCGLSHNKPFCDGSHMEAGFNDGLEQSPENMNPANL